MRSRKLAVLAILTASLMAFSGTATAAPETKQNYVVQLEDNAGALGQEKISKAIQGLGGSTSRSFRNVFRGFVASLTPSAASTLANTPLVKNVLPDIEIHASDVQTPTPSWGLDRLDQTLLPLNSSFTYPTSAGEGVRIFVVDTGVQTSDPDFAGRITTGVDFVGDGKSADVDCNGHGTHVAGTAAGTEFGVAKKATITGLRVLGCTGSGSFSYFIAAADYVAGLNLNGARAVFTASLGADNYIYQPALDAVTRLVNNGVVVTLAAGNGNVDACGSSPAAAPLAITVGATTSNDSRASYSNFGSCLDIFAPGSAITSDLNTDPNGTWTISGTSMATPHVAGAAALYLALNSAATPSQVLTALQTNSVSGKVSSAGTGSPNYLLNTSFLNSGTPPPVVDPVAPDAPTGLNVTNRTSSAISLSWTPPANTGTASISGYRVEYKASSSSSWTGGTVTTAGATVSGLASGTSYDFQVKAISADGTSVASSPVTASTLLSGTVPSVPRSPKVVTRYSNQISLSWSTPSANGGQPITGYKIQQLIGSTWTTVATTTTTSGAAPGLTASTSYSFRILATNAIGDSSPSVIVTGSTISATPAKVGTPSVTVGTAGAVTVKWTAVPVVTFGTPITYFVEFTNSLGTTVVQSTTVSTNSLSITLARLTSYKVRVTAISGAISGAASTLSSTFTTK